MFESIKMAIQMRNINNRNDMKDQLWRELNEFRLNPMGMYDMISSYKNNFNKNKLLFSPNHVDQAIQTEEGREGVDKLLQELLLLKNMEPIYLNQQLCNVAAQIANKYKHSYDQGYQFKNIPEETRKDLNRKGYNLPPQKLMSIIGVGFLNKYEPLVSLLINDGDEKKRNRQCLTNKKWSSGGIGVQLLSNNNLICVVYIFI